MTLNLLCFWFFFLFSLLSHKMRSSVMIQHTSDFFQWTSLCAISIFLQLFDVCVCVCLPVRSHVCICLKITLWKVPTHCVCVIVEQKKRVSLLSTIPLTQTHFGYLYTTINFQLNAWFSNPARRSLPWLFQILITPLSQCISCTLIYVILQLKRTHTHSHFLCRLNFTDAKRWIKFAISMF